MVMDAITELLLSRADDSGHRYYSLSSAIMKNRKKYYDVLEYSQKSTMDIPEDNAECDSGF